LEQLVWNFMKQIEKQKRFKKLFKWTIWLQINITFYFIIGSDLNSTSGFQLDLSWHTCIVPSVWFTHIHQILLRRPLKLHSKFQPVFLGFFLVILNFSFINFFIGCFLVIADVWTCLFLRFKSVFDKIWKIFIFLLTSN
jgi:hypothetical protein